MVAHTKMTGGFAFTIMLLSPEDEQDLKWRWYIIPKGYAMFTQGTRELVHRWVMRRMLGKNIPNNVVVDHIDGNRINNTRENLQLITQSENRLKGKSGFAKNRKSSYRRVSPEKERWRATIQTPSGVNRAMFKLEIDAAIYADIIVILELTEQASINFPELRDKEKLKSEMLRLNLSQYYFNLLEK